LKEQPLRLPGESLQSELIDVVVGDLLLWYLGAAGLTLLAILEWLATVGHWGRHPLLYSALAAAAIGVCLWRYLRARPRIRNLQLGRRGERVVAESLEWLREAGASVFHDVPADGFNIDHVVLSVRGYFAIETKTRSKPAGRRAEVSFRGEQLLIDGVRPDRDPVRQAQRTARWLEDLLAQRTRKRIPVRGVVLFPGWWVEPMEESWRRSSELPWVMNPEMLRAHLAESTMRVSREDVHLATTHLAAYVRDRSDRIAQRP